MYEMWEALNKNNDEADGGKPHLTVVIIMVMTMSVMIMNMTMMMMTMTMTMTMTKRILPRKSEMLSHSTPP